MKSNIIFIPIPEYLRDYINKRDDLIINPDIPIPIEAGFEGEHISLENLSVNMIISGMLRVLETREVEQEWLDYYSRFVIAMRPDILAKLKEISDRGLDDEYFIKAHQLIQEGRTEEGLTFIRDFLERFPLVWNGWFILGWALRLLGRYGDAEAAFNKAIELGGENCDTLNELAICLMEKGDTEGARRKLEAALYYDTENVKIISNLGMLAAKSGDKEKAAAFFRTVLEIDSNDPVAKKYLGNGE
jgi:Flp pilus assembly protein TadD